MLVSVGGATGITGFFELGSVWRMRDSDWHRARGGTIWVLRNWVESHCEIDGCLAKYALDKMKLLGLLLIS